jgi:hypothetical protein
MILNVNKNVLLYEASIILEESEVYDILEEGIISRTFNNPVKNKVQKLAKKDSLKKKAKARKVENVLAAKKSLGDTGVVGDAIKATGNVLKNSIKNANFSNISSRVAKDFKDRRVKNLAQGETRYGLLMQQNKEKQTIKNKKYKIRKEIIKKEEEEKSSPTP